MNNKESMIELLEEFLDFLKEKEGDSKENEVEVIETEDDTVTDDDDDDDFNNEIDRISKGE